MTSIAAPEISVDVLDDVTTPVPDVGAVGMTEASAPSTSLLHEGRADSSPSFLPSWSKEAGGHRLPSTPRGSAVNQPTLGSQPAIPFPPPASPATHSQEIDREGKGRAGHTNTRTPAPPPTHCQNLIDC
ncbi:hypothetical protein ZWY2020_000060 [Hordeum vulgare]|nr:hypothetical protein ZWY2020_000060 [Hordeum vulgare]